MAADVAPFTLHYKRCFRLAAAGVLVAAKCQKFLEELHLVSIKRSGFDFLAVVLRPLCSVANYVGLEC